MPPYLASPHFHLYRLPISTKVVLTMFSLTLLAAIGFVGIGVFEERTGYTTEGVQKNYVGSERYAEETGELIPEREAYRAEKSKREIYDIIHPHSFLMPILFFILCHMMEMASAPLWAKLTLYIGSGVAMLGVIFSPWLILQNMPAAVILVPSVVVMLLFFIVMIVIPPVQMWTGWGAPRR